MLYYLVGIILVVFINRNLSLDEPMTVKEVVMHGKAQLQYSAQRYDIICFPNCDFLRPDPPYDIKMYVLECEFQPTSNYERILNIFTDIDRRIRNVEHQPCGSYDNNEIFTILKHQAELTCGDLFQVNAKGAPNSFVKPSYDIGFTSKMLLGNLFILGILALLKKECVVSTLMWNHDIFSLQSIPSGFHFPINFVVFQTYWDFPIDDLVSRTEPDYIFIINFKSGNKWNRSFYAQMIAKVQTRCYSGFYMTRCWYYCQNVPGKYTCHPRTGLQICLNEWYTSLVMYVNTYKPFLNFSSVIIPECNMINKCYRHNCSDICVATGNNTSTCIGDRLQFEPEDMHLYAGDVIRCFMAFQEEPTNDTYISWFYIQNFNGSNNAFSNIMMDGNILFVLLKAFPSHNNLVRCAVIDTTGKVKLEELRNYSIILRPTLIFLNISLDHAYLGDYVKCYSNAWPSNYYQYMLNIDSATTHQNFSSNSNIIYIPEYHRLGKAFFKCTTLFQVDVNTTKTFFRIFRVYIYAMRAFRWTKKRTPIYFVNDSAKLVVDIRVPYNLEIIQLTGPSDVVMFGKKIVFNNFCHGGVYQFVAILYIGNYKSFITFFRFFKAILFSAPTYVKMSSYVGYPKEMIYCLTNAFPQEFVKYRFKFSRETRGDILNVSTNFLILPVNSTIHVNYQIECSYKMIIYNKTYRGRVSDWITIIPRPQAYELIYKEYVKPLKLAMCSFIFLYHQFGLILLFVIMACYWINGNEFVHLYNTFLQYNIQRRGIRYHEKMSHIAKIVLSIKKKFPDDKVKLATFYKYLKLKKRDSLTPGFAVPPRSKKQKDLSKEEEDEDYPYFYGIGPRLKYLRFMKR